MNISFEAKGDFNELSRWLDKVSKTTPTVALKQIASEGERSLAANTPRDTGRTATGWKAVITSKGAISEISWNNNAHPGLSVNVARIIDQGHGTGTGGYVPPRPYVKKSMDAVWKDAGDRIAKELIK